MAQDGAQHGQPGRAARDRNDAAELVGHLTSAGRTHDGGVSRPVVSRTRHLLVIGVALVVAGMDIWLQTQTTEAPLRTLLSIAVLASFTMASFWRRPTRWFAALLAAVVLASVGAGTWIGANSPRARWFGDQVSHGARDVNAVALTFDDGPNTTATLQIRDILDGRGVKGTFFSVGKAVAARADISRDVVGDGHIVGNHSYTHDSLHWLDPFYGELGQTQREIKRDVGVCPAFFRAPHGQHTPLMAAVVHRHGMTMIGWDVSVGDWAVRDPRVVATNVVNRARPGSIIDLHDGLDGRVNVDRVTLVQAMPMILDGLAAKGLRVARLDALLGRPAYLRDC